MNLAELKKEHPEAYEAAVAEGVSKERDRVSAHLEFGNKSGALETAHNAILEGAEMTQHLIAQYMTAGMNRADAGARQEETDAAAEALGAVAPENKEAKDLADKVWEAYQNGADDTEVHVYIPEGR